MDKKRIKLSKGFRKYLRYEKAAIKKQYLGHERKAKLSELFELYKKLIQEKSKIKPKKNIVDNLKGNELSVDKS